MRDVEVVIEAVFDRGALGDLRFGVECLVGIAERDSRDRIRIRRSARLGSRH